MNLSGWEETTYRGLRVSRVVAGTDDNSRSPFVSVIVPTIGRRSLRPAILSILGYDYPSFELLVVHDEKRVGSTVALNIGLKSAKGDLTHFAEDDCEYTKSNLKALVRRYFDVRFHDPRCAGVVGSFLPLVWGQLGARFSIHVSPEGIKTTTIFGEGRTDYLTPGNALCSKEAILQCGGFNEQLCYMSEDVELSLVLKREGYTLYNCIDALAEHKNEPRLEGRSGRILRNSAYFRVRNREILHRTWCGNPVKFVVGELVRDIRASIRYKPPVEPHRDIGWKRLADRRKIRDRVSHTLGIIAGMTTTTKRKTI